MISGIANREQHLSRPRAWRSRTPQAPAVGATVVLHLRSELPPLDLAEPVSVIRVTRPAGGYRCGVQFLEVNAANRAKLGRFVIAVMRDRAA
jgi:hypothetical protein